MKEIELKHLRRKREKHFLQNDGTIVAKVYDHDIHFIENGKYEEIDDTLIKLKNYYTNKKNKFRTYFYENDNHLMKLEKDNNYINIKIKTEKPYFLEKQGNNIFYKEILNNIDLKYQMFNNKVKEEILLKNKESITNEICFELETNLELKLDGKNIKAVKDNEVIFIIDAPYMFDSNNIVNNNINYELKRIDDKYELRLILDKEWLNRMDIKYPVIIDPTITSRGEEYEVYDTYIYSGDTSIDRNSQDILKAGVERINGKDVINRSLVRFELPKLGTGSQIISAHANFVGYPVLFLFDIDDSEIVNVHQITEPWEEATANWQNMNDKYNSRIEGSFNSVRSATDTSGNVTAYSAAVDLTNLVKKWYANTPNYGIMLKANEEIYKSDKYPAFFSKNNNANGANPKPYLTIVYRNQNGLEEYMEYTSQALSRGAIYMNNYNGNLTGLFNIGSTIGGKFPANLNLVYNTNDVVLNNNIGYGLGYRLNFNQIIEEYPVEEITYLKYIDSDGTIHYFRNYNGIYKDEDGLNLTVSVYDTEYILKDKNSNQMKFVIINKIGYLKEILDASNNKIEIFYNSDNTISKIVDANNQEINIVYEDNKISIISPNRNVVINYTNGKPYSIVSNTGAILFTHNIHNIIESITDENGLKLIYEYYDVSPYRVKKVSQYGINDELGDYFNVEYNFNSTTIIDSKNRARTMTFNNFGNVEAISSLKSKEDIKNAYGQTQTYGRSFTTVDGEYNYHKNKLLNVGIPAKYVKNYLTNTSFETDEIIFTPSANTILSMSGEYSETGQKSLKIVNSSLNETIIKSINLEKNKHYTFSTYIKNDNNIRLALSYTNNNQELVEVKSSLIKINTEFNRYDVTIFYGADAVTDLNIKVYLETIGTLYMDDIQLEEGEVANSYNLLENSDFSNGIIDWDLSATEYWGTDELPVNDIFEIVTLSNNTKALRVKMNPNQWTSFEKIFNISGKGGDTYNISFWYKNEGFVGFDTEGAGIHNNVIISFNYIDQNGGHGISPSRAFNPNDNEWQYFSTTFVAEKDYDSIRLHFYQSYNANNFYITNLCLFKDFRGISYGYDDNDNVIQTSGLNNEVKEFNYDKNNQLIQMITPKGNNFTFECDNLVIDRTLKGISPTGISNEIIYDEFGNPIITRIINRGKEIGNGLYKIRIKGTNKCLRNNLMFSETNCNHDLWELEKENEGYKIKHAILNKYITILNNNLVLSDENISLFIFVKNNNGSYLIKNSNKYFKNNNNKLVLNNLIENDYNFEFYLENVNDLFIENNAEYSTDGRFIKSTIDSLLNKTKYDIDETTGLVRTVTDPKNQVTSYEYDDKRRLVKVINNNKTISYNYNSNDGLEKIIEGNRVYNFSYDGFLKTNEIKIGNEITLITNNYENNNGNLNKIVYGNNHSINFNYDEFDRISKLERMDDIYNYKYSANGELLKVISNEDTVEYKYDLAKRLKEYSFNDFKIKYSYDKHNNVIAKQYVLNNYIYNITNEYNDDDVVTKMYVDDNNINYVYDYLGRITKRSINNNYNTEYEYVTNGKRTSLLPKSIKNGNDLYKYKYDKLNNITHIYNNNNLINRYYYDEYNQLIKEHNYALNETTEYIYDNYGNILNKKTYILNTENILNQDNYEYNNINWMDQLTKFNGETIMYDEIGNPVMIGTKILEWTNGSKLRRYNDGVNNITYKYNKDGIRISKVVNDEETKYYLEGNKIMLEIRGNNSIYYIYDDVGDLIGFKYNDSLYYYVKDIQNNIIGILDENYNKLVNYIYDAWGNVISITDNENNNISDDSNNIGNINPFRYRSYYYDVETKLYYLNSRYYNPVWRRFLNIDEILNTIGTVNNTNLYGYTNNNPISRLDSNGDKWYYFGIDKLIDLIESIFNYSAKKATKGTNFKIDSPIKNKTKKTNETNKVTDAIVEIVANTTVSYQVGVSVSGPVGTSYNIGYTRVVSPNSNLNSKLINVGSSWSIGGGLPISPYANLSIKFSPTYSVDELTGGKTSESFGIFYQVSQGTYSSADDTFTIGISPSFGYGQGMDYYWDIGR